MNSRRVVLTIGLLAISTTAWAQTGGQSSGTFGSPDIYNTGKTGSKTLPPEGATPPNSAANTSAESGLKQTLQDIYNRCVAATKKRDESVLVSLRTPDFTYRDTKGKTLARADVEANERQALASVVSMDKVSSQVETVKAAGGKTTATLHHYFAATVNDAQNKPHKITLNTTSQEVWTTRAGAWKLQSVKVVSQQETLDGKPYDPNTQNNTNKQNGSQNNGNGRQAARNSGYNGYGSNGYRAPRIRTPRIRTFGGRIIP